jgi:hypothetical protein
VSERIVAGRFEAGGVAFTVETNRREFAAVVADAFRDLRVREANSAPVVFEVVHRATGPPTNPWGVWRDGEPCELTVSDGYVLAFLLWEVTRLMFERTGERVHLHGAALVRNGRAIVLAGRSEAGKSTLACWLTHRGWGFLTDEAALVNPDTLVVEPFWRPIGVRRPGPLDAILPDGAPGGHGDHELLVPASTIGALAPAAPLAALAFPVLTREEAPTVSPLSPAAALVELTAHFPGLVEEGRAGFRRLAGLVRVVPAHELRFFDLDDAERMLRRLVSDRP